MWRVGRKFHFWRHFIQAQTSVLWLCEPVSVFVAKFPLARNWAQSLSYKWAGPHCRQGPNLRAMPRCLTTNRLIVEHYLAVPCLSYGISAWGSTRDVCRHVPGRGLPCLCLSATRGQVDGCSSRVCGIVSTMERQLGLWHLPVNDL